MHSLTFRKISTRAAFDKLMTFLTEDVKKHGGSASETIDMHGVLRDIIVASTPWGIVRINRETTKLDAIASFMGAIAERETVDKHTGSFASLLRLIHLSRRECVPNWKRAIESDPFTNPIQLTRSNQT